MNNKRVSAGILSIVSGSLGILFTAWGIFLITVFIPVAAKELDVDTSALGLITSAATIIPMLMGIASLVAIMGGIFAIRRKRWGVALTGTIASIVAFWPTGIVATVMLTGSKDQFTDH
jgi:hypothetical protein